jgi:hypothetical protein
MRLFPVFRGLYIRMAAPSGDSNRTATRNRGTAGTAGTRNRVKRLRPTAEMSGRSYRRHEAFGPRNMRTGRLASVCGVGPLAGPPMLDSKLAQFHWLSTGPEVAYTSAGGRVHNVPAARYTEGAQGGARLVLSGTLPTHRPAAKLIGPTGRSPIAPPGSLRLNDAYFRRVFEGNL